MKAASAACGARGEEKERPSLCHVTFSFSFCSDTLQFGSPVLIGKQRCTAKHGGHVTSETAGGKEWVHAVTATLALVTIAKIEDTYCRGGEEEKMAWSRSSGQN